MDVLCSNIIILETKSASTDSELSCASCWLKLLGSPNIRRILHFALGLINNPSTLLYVGGHHHPRYKPIIAPFGAWRKDGIGRIWWSFLRRIKGLQLSILSLYLPWIAIIKAHVVTWPN